MFASSSRRAPPHSESSWSLSAENFAPTDASESGSAGSSSASALLVPLPCADATASVAATKPASTLSPASARTASRSARAASTSSIWCLPRVFCAPTLWSTACACRSIEASASCSCCSLSSVSTRWNTPSPVEPLSTLTSWIIMLAGSSGVLLGRGCRPRPGSSRVGPGAAVPAAPPSGSRPRPYRWPSTAPAPAGSRLSLLATGCPRSAPPVDGAPRGVDASVSALGVSSTEMTAPLFRASISLSVTTSSTVLTLPISTSSLALLPLS
jgi:hypothetical protein